MKSLTGLAWTTTDELYIPFLFDKVYADFIATTPDTWHDNAMMIRPYEYLFFNNDIIFKHS